MALDWTALSTSHEANFVDRDGPKRLERLLIANCICRLLISEIWGKMRRAQDPGKAMNSARLLSLLRMRGRTLPTTSRHDQTHKLRQSTVKSLKGLVD